MRTTITLSPEIHDLLREYLKHFSKRLGTRISLSSIIEEAVNASLPLMLLRMHQKGEDKFDFLIRRKDDLKRRLTHDLTRMEIIAIMREISFYIEYCRCLLNDKTKYHKCLNGFTELYTESHSKEMTTPW